MFAGVNPLYFIVGMATLGLAPFFLMMITSYVKIIVVTSLVRNALVWNSVQFFSQLSLDCQGTINIVHV